MLLENTALICPHCNSYKSDYADGIDTLTGEIVELFHECWLTVSAAKWTPSKPYFSSSRYSDRREMPST